MGGKQGVMGAIGRLLVRGSSALSLLGLLVQPTAAVAGTVPDDGTVWSTAVARHAENDRAIVYRYISALPATVSRQAFPVRIILVWRYDSASGMPQTAERERMDQMEDLLAPAVESSGLARLLMVSTGENLREWTYYTRDEEAFMTALNQALAEQPAFPLQIHIAPDPDWHSYESFRQGVVVSDIPEAQGDSTP